MSYFKVVAIVDGRKVSHVVNGSEPEVEYKEGEWVEAHEWLTAKGYHPVVFDSLESVRRYLGRCTETDEGLARYFEFSTGNPKSELWECECEDEVKELPIFLDYLSTYMWKKIFHNGEFDRIETLEKWPQAPSCSNESNSPSVFSRRFHTNL